MSGTGLPITRRGRRPRRPAAVDYPGFGVRGSGFGMDTHDPVGVAVPGDPPPLCGRKGHAGGRCRGDGDVDCPVGATLRARRATRSCRRKPVPGRAVNKGRRLSGIRGSGFGIRDGHTRSRRGRRPRRPAVADSPYGIFSTAKQKQRGEDTPRDDGIISHIFIYSRLSTLFDKNLCKKRIYYMYYSHPVLLFQKNCAFALFLCKTRLTTDTV